MQVVLIFLLTFVGSTAATLSGNTADTCGNGIVDAGEMCDDGNVASFDNCPPDCTISECENPQGTVEVTVKLAGDTTAEAGDLSALTVFVEYPDGRVQLPGTGSGADASRFEAQNGSAQVTVNDLDYGARILMVDPFSKLGVLPLKIEYDVCNGAKVSADDFRCRVEFAGDTKANVLHDVHCSVQVE